VPSSDALYVANARDGSVRLFRGDEYTPTGRIDLGSDADNVRVDVEANRVLVGHSNGAIAAIDTAQQKKFGDVLLPAHPESFQIAQNPKQVFVNLPDAHVVGVSDGSTGAQKASWQLREGGNFPMALDEATARVLIVSRSPPKLIVLSQKDGSRIAEAETCGDSDDVFVDVKRSRVYVSCGAGFIDVFAVDGDNYARAARIQTISGARTSFFVPDLGLLLLGVRTGGGEGAAIWVYRAVP
jgi:hypothetical protein